MSSYICTDPGIFSVKLTVKNMKEKIIWVSEEQLFLSSADFMLHLAASSFLVKDECPFWVGLNILNLRFCHLKVIIKQEPGELPQQSPAPPAGAASQTSVPQYVTVKGSHMIALSPQKQIVNTGEGSTPAKVDYFFYDICFCFVAIPCCHQQSSSSTAVCLIVLLREWTHRLIVK